MQSVIGRDWDYQLIPTHARTRYPTTTGFHITRLILMDWWSMWDSNPRSPACKAGALAI